MLKITADKDRCVGAGQCVLSAPDVFDQDDDGVVTLLDETPGAEHADDVRQAALICPSQAITVEEA
ncbi:MULTISPECIES: ferredoxin [Saccharopolyspora]|uniref:Ferredoxin n=1 Tax=Saccharopolyspora gregorii TaxID=33914 RepID=A0ABP6RP46_9PSEU|nr:MULTISPECIES: ferredoxin [Saccharopolyspora]MCA1186029.1 ferredoxin [Saccharopolyspora sp. 6T]MCA1192409.1 ferredoxin [Saccharopolyspora sp. 6V]MCA1227784.1 ferredoxin [Saccharopolyspora sp. 6M]MCA1280033.1 ferredoxin [Saccharopolyspora sp. 7B]